MKFVVDGFGAWKSDGCSVYDVLDSSLITFNCTQLSGYAVLLVSCCMLSGQLRLESKYDLVKLLDCGLMCSICDKINVKL